MRDLIRNYKMIIKGKNRDSDTETDPLLSSTSSSGSQNFGAVRESPIFKAESCSSEDDRSKNVEKKQTLPFGIQNSKRQTQFPSRFSEINDCETSSNLFDGQLFPKLLSELVTLERDILGEPVEDLPKERRTNHSIVTIFSVWNTTMGSSLLAMSWGFEKTGLFPGIIINILVAALFLYTAYVLLNINEKHGIPGQNIEVPDLCRMLIGRWAEIVTKIVSLIVLSGACIVYWILMSNFLYNLVAFLYGLIVDNGYEEESTLLCPSQFNINLNDTVQNRSSTVSNATFDKFWNLYSTVPVFLAVALFPLLNFKSPTFFSKFNSMGTISVCYLLLFVTIKGFQWGINLPNVAIEFEIKPTFCALTGMLSLSYFIHNILISMMRHNRNQEHNGRDLSIAFGLVTFTYLFIGVVFYITFPLAKSCIEDNILKNFSKRDVLTIIARVLLLFQLFTVFPLISFMLRNDVLSNFNYFNKRYRLGEFSYLKVIIINLVIVFLCIMFACFLPRIGTLIRYTGAMSGLVYIFIMPSLLKIASLKKEQNLTIPKLVFYIIIVIVGVVNMFSQFFINA